jgi:hypothetical protein
MRSYQRFDEDGRRRAILNVRPWFFADVSVPEIDAHFGPFGHCKRRDFYWSARVLR